MSLSEKNSICNLAHVALKILLHILTKIQLIEPDLNEDGEARVKQIDTLYPHYKHILYELLHDKEVPMDTKSLCGLVLLTVECMVFNSLEAYQYVSIPLSHVCVWCL